MQLDQSFLEREIFPRLDRAWVFKTLDPQDRGNYILCRCPGCGERSAYCYKNKYKIHCNRANECGYEATILTFLNGDEKPTGQEFFELVKKLCEHVGIQAPERDMSPEKMEAVRKSQEIADRMELVLAEAKKNTPEKMSQFLLGKGVTQSQIAILDVGALNAVEQFKSLGISEHWINRLILTARDKWGRIKAFSARALDGQEPKYLHTKDADFKALGAAGLDVALSRGNTSIMLVEGLIDVYVGRSLGYEKIAALCGPGSHLTTERLELLYKLGVRQIILAFDADKAGLDGTERAIDNSLQAKNCPELYVVDMSVYPRAKDPGEIAQVHGLDGLLVLERTAIHAYRWKARAMAARMLGEHDGQREIFLTSAIKWDEPVTDSRRVRSLLEYFWPEVQELTGCDLDSILDIRNELRTARSANEQRERLIAGVRNAQDALKVDNLEEALYNITAAASEVRRSKFGTIIEPILTVAQRLPANNERLAARSGLEFIGLPQRTLPDLDKLTLGLRRLITVASGPGTGKTILVSQLVQDILANNLDSCAVFVSWELTGDEIIDRMKSRASRVSWEELQLRSTPEMRDAADRALENIADRIVILEPENCPDLNAEKILTEVALLKSRTGCKRAVVVIDYFQIFPVPDEITESKNEINVEKYLVDQMKKIRRHLGDDPLIVISEVNKSDGTMRAEGMEKVKGSVRLIYASDAVFLINTLSDEQLVHNAYLRNGQVMPIPRYGGWDDSDDIKKAELKEKAQELRDALTVHGKDFLELAIVKIRDGGKRKRFFMTNFYNISAMEPGIQ